MNTRNIIAKYKGNSIRGSYQHGTIYVLSMNSGEHCLSLWRKTWHSWLFMRGFMNYTRQDFYHNWELLEQCA